MASDSEGSGGEGRDGSQGIEESPKPTKRPGKQRASREKTTDGPKPGSSGASRGKTKKRNASQSGGQGSAKKTRASKTKMKEVSSSDTDDDHLNFDPQPWLEAGYNSEEKPASVGDRSPSRPAETHPQPGPTTTSGTPKEPTEQIDTPAAAGGPEITKSTKPSEVPASKSQVPGSAESAKSSKTQAKEPKPSTQQLPESGASAITQSVAPPAQQDPITTPLPHESFTEHHRLGRALREPGQEIQKVLGQASKCTCQPSHIIQQLTPVERQLEMLLPHVDHMLGGSFEKESVKQMIRELGNDGKEYQVLIQKLDEMLQRMFTVRDMFFQAYGATNRENQQDWAKLSRHAIEGAAQVEVILTRIMEVLQSDGLSSEKLQRQQ